MGTEHGAAQGCHKAGSVCCPVAWPAQQLGKGLWHPPSRPTPHCSFGSVVVGSESLSASLSLWYLLYNLLGRGRWRDKQEEEVVQRKMSHCICSSPSSRVNQEVL